MHSNNKFRLIAVLALALAGMALVASQAVAHGGHGNHRGDRQARLDSDHDGASNRCELQADLNGSSTDSDSNGTIDGLEDSDGDGANNAAESRLRTNCAVANKRFKIRNATVKSYSAEGGLVLAIGKRGLVTASVSDKVVCEQDDATEDSSGATASVSRHGGDDEAGDDRGSREDEPGDDRGGDRRGGDDHPSGDDDENDPVACTTADLTEGASVLGAKIKNGVVTRIHLASADEGDF